MSYTTKRNANRYKSVVCGNAKLCESHKKSQGRTPKTKKYKSPQQFYKDYLKKDGE